MKILGITSRLPFPLTDGARICMFQAAYGLTSLGHELHLVAIEDEMFDPGPLSDFCRVHIIPYKPLPTALGALATLLHYRPYTQWKKDLGRVYDYLDRLHRQEKFDVVYADQAHIAQYGAYMKARYRLPYMLRSHNIEHEIYRRHTDTVRNPLMLAYLRLQCRRWERFEIEQLRLADSCAAITSRDRQAINRFAPGLPCDTIPAAVDLAMFPYTPVEEREDRSMIMLGNMAWAPNRDAAIWFTNEILPLVVREIPDAVCHLVGDNPPLKQLPAPSANLRIEGRVETIRSFYDRMAIGLIPLRVGGGMRVKMVEMMASGMPIVSTALGAEGNDATPGEHFVQMDDVAGFASAIVRLLRDRTERARMSRSAYTFVSDHYSMRDVGRKYESLLIEAMKRQQTGVAVR